MTPMIARVLLLTLALPISVSAQTPSSKSAPQKIPATKNEPSHDQETARELRAITSELRAIREQAARNQEQQAKRKPEKGPPVWSNWFLVVVAGLTGFAAWRTLNAIEQQVIANKDAAIAAKDNAVAASANATAARDAADETRRQNQLIENQSGDMKASIAEASRSAGAMERIAEAMAVSVESVKESVGISREIADTQKMLTRIQSRAYMAVTFELVLMQRTGPNATMFVVQVASRNTGNTPAYNVRSFTTAQVLPYPLGTGFDFPLGRDNPDAIGSVIASGQHRINTASLPSPIQNTTADQILDPLGAWRLYAWGRIRYRDAFGDQQETRFAFSCFKAGDGPNGPIWMSFDEPRGNESTQPDHG